MPLHRMQFASAKFGFGTFETCQRPRAMSEFEKQSGKHMLGLSSSQFDLKADLDQASIFLRICLWPFRCGFDPLRCRRLSGSRQEATKVHCGAGWRAFATQYDPIPRHIDEQDAARSVFGGLTASGSHTFAICILLTGQLQPHCQVLMGLGWDEVRLLNPVRPGDELDLEMTVMEMRASKSKSDRGIVRNRNLLRNQKRETVLECISNIFVARRPDASAPTPG
jgi:acyl dehydratase